MQEKNPFIILYREVFLQLIICLALAESINIGQHYEDNKLSVKQLLMSSLQ